MPRRGKQGRHRGMDPALSRPRHVKQLSVPQGDRQTQLSLMRLSRERGESQVQLQKSALGPIRIGSVKILTIDKCPQLTSEGIDDTPLFCCLVHARGIQPGILRALVV